MNAEATCSVCTCDDSMSGPSSSDESFEDSISEYTLCEVML